MNKAVIMLLFSTAANAANPQLEESADVELDEVVVSTPAKQVAEEDSHSSTVLTGDRLRNKIGQNIGDTLKNEAGITSQSFGPGVGSPVIRGQAGARVKVMQNGLGNNDVSTLSPDHANSVEPILAEKIEVLRGAATLLYGSGAIGGVVNVIDNRIPQSMPDKLLGGAAEQRYDSSTNETASVVKVEGGKKSLAYHLDGFYRSHSNLRISGNAIDENAARATDPTLADVTTLENSNGMIKDTRGWSRGGSAGLSYIGDKGLIGASINHLQNNYGIPADGSGSEPVSVYMQQSKYDLKAQLDEPFTFVKALRYKFGYTDYQHTELDNGVAATRFLNESFENRLELEHQAIAGIKGVLGFQSTNSQFAALGDEAIVPRSDIDSYGGFLVESFTSGNFTYEMGARIENQTIKPEQGSQFSYLPLSGSASVLWKINQQHQISLAATHSERPPLVQELLSNGVHAATRSYEMGSTDLGKEFSNNLDLGYRYHSAWLTAEINLFHNWVNDYIYQKRSGQVFNTDTNEDGNEIGMENSCSSTTSSACLPVELSQQRNAIFRGFEAKLTLPMMKNEFGTLDLNLFTDYTRGFFVHGGGNVPRMPPLRYGFELDYDYQNLSTNFRLTRAQAQNYTAANDSNTAGYLQLSMGAQYKIASFKESKVTLFANGRNLLNETIRNSTSYLRNFAPDAGRSAEVGVRVSY